MTVETSGGNKTGVTVTTTGYYEINYGVVANTSGSNRDFIGIQINSGNANSGSVVHHGNASPGIFGTGSIILQVTNGSTIRLINAAAVPGGSHFDLHSDLSGTSPTLSAYLIVKYLGS
jgi:hypothetical protein